MVAAERGLRLSVGSLTRRSRPQQLSTFALTLYQHRARVGGQEVRVGEWGQPGGHAVFPGTGGAMAEGTAGNWRSPWSGSCLRVLVDYNILADLVPFCDRAAALVDGAK